MDIKANHLRLTGACLLDSNVNKLHNTYALGMMHKQQFIEHSSGMLPKYIWFLIPFLIFCLKFYWKKIKDWIKPLSQWVCNHEWFNSIWNEMHPNRVISSSRDFQSASHISLNGLQTTEPAANFGALNSTLNP